MPPSLVLKNSAPRSRLVQKYRITQKINRTGANLARGPTDKASMTRPSARRCTSIAAGSEILRVFLIHPSPASRKNVNGSLRAEHSPHERLKLDTFRMPPDARLSSMKISVVLTTYNQPAWLEKVIWGYSTQSFQNFEVVVTTPRLCTSLSERMGVK